MGRPRLNLIGKRFGKLLVTGFSHLDSKKNSYFNTICECGKKSIVRGSHLTSERVRSCGCLISDTQFKDLSNKKFGLLTAIKPVTTYNRKYIWLCKCECGSLIEVRSDSLISGNTMSCGCLVSKGELLISKFLLSKNIDFRKQFTFKDCKNINPLPFDFAAFKEGQLWFLIEFDGEQHFGKGGYANETIKERDIIKNNYCSYFGIPFLRIPYTKINSINFILEQFLQKK
jgi:hypothetical protein